jgi:hypothetical protein
VTYYFCETCKFLHTEEPYWLKEAYSDAIVASDTGIVRRNLDTSAKSAAIFMWMFAGKGRFLDVAGGYGLLTRLMRDMGFDYYWSDAYALNCFARGFEADLASNQVYRGATAFEAIEHMEDPLGFIKSVVERTQCDTFLFSTELYEGDEPPKTWWYYGQESGQHISFFHRITLQAIAAELKMTLHSTGSIHLLSRKMISPLVFRLLTSRLSAKLCPLFFSVFRRPKIAADHETLAKKASQSS